VRNKEAVAASSIANVMIAAILNGDLPLAGKMMEQDKWHETSGKTARLFSVNNGSSGINAMTSHIGK
jgi:homoserine kinase